MPERLRNKLKKMEEEAKSQPVVVGKTEHVII